MKLIMKLIKNEPTLEQEFRSTVSQTIIFFPKNTGVDREKLFKDAYEQVITVTEIQQDYLVLPSIT
jgi:hypothetical protein